MPPKRKATTKAPAKAPSKKQASNKSSNDSEKADVLHLVEGFASGKPLMDLSGGSWGLDWSLDLDPTVLTLDSVQLPGSEKIIAFDMDWTLIKTKSGAAFAKSASDWDWWHPCVVPTLKKYFENGYKIVIFTNQAGIEKKKASPADVKKKILDLSVAAGVPFQAFAASHTNHLRKPHTGMWDRMVADFNKGVTPNLSQCYYVGDAAGRTKGWGPDKKKDFGCGDRKFAVNNKISFATPEEFFLGDEAVAFEWRSVDPAALLKKAEGQKHFTGSSITKEEQEMVLFCGFPAVGKSTFAEKHMPNYVWVNRDTLKTPAKCVKVAVAALKEGKSVVVDNTSADVSARGLYIDAAKEFPGVAVRCFYFDIEREVASHLNFFREHMTQGQRRRVPDVGFNMFKKKFKEPTTKEGFSEVCTVHFAPAFDSPADREAFLHWTE